MLQFWACNKSKENGSATRNDHSCYVHSSSHWWFTSKAPSLPTHGPVYWDLLLGQSVLPPVAPLLIPRQEAGLGHFPSYLPEALFPKLGMLASLSVPISIPLWNTYIQEVIKISFKRAFGFKIMVEPFDYLDMQTGLSPLSLRFTYSIFSFGYHWTSSSSGDTEFEKKIIIHFCYKHQTHRYTCSKQNHCKVNAILKFSWGLVHFHWHYFNKRPTCLNSHLSIIHSTVRNSPICI